MRRLARELPDFARLLTPDELADRKRQAEEYNDWRRRRLEFGIDLDVDAPPSTSSSSTKGTTLQELLFTSDSEGREGQGGGREDDHEDFSSTISSRGILELENYSSGDEIKDGQEHPPLSAS